MNLLEMNVQSLRVVYNKLTRRRDPSVGTFYDVFSGKNAKIAEACFRKLAARLQREKINPKKFLVILSNYGEFSTHNRLPYPSFFCSDKAFKIYEWKSKADAKKYFDEDQLVRNSIQGVEASSEEVLGAVKADVKEIKKMPIDRKNPAIIFALRDGLKPWYLVLHKQFMQSEYFDMLDKNERKLIKQCRSFYKQNPRIKQKALEVIYG